MSALAAEDEPGPDRGREDGAGTARSRIAAGIWESATAMISSRTTTPWSMRSASSSADATVGDTSRARPALAAAALSSRPNEPVSVVRSLVEIMSVVDPITHLD